MTCTTSSGGSSCPTITNLAPSYVGDDLVIDLSFNDPSTGLPIDLTGGLIVLTIKAKKLDVEPVYQDIQQDIEMLLPTEGLVQFFVPAVVTGDWLVRTYTYDIVYQNPQGTHTTVLIGSVQMNRPTHNSHPFTFIPL